MLHYLINKKKSEKTIGICSLVFWILNLIFLQLSVNMLIKIIFAGNSDWFTAAAENEALKDAFFLNRSDLIMGTMVVILIAVIIFSIVTILLLRNLQLKNMLTQIGVYRVVGYSKRKILGITMQDVIADMVVAIPVATICTTFAWNAIAKHDMVSVLMEMMNNQWWMDAIAYVGCIGLMIMAVVTYSMFFIHKSIKKGVRYMLGKGIV